MIKRFANNIGSLEGKVLLAVSGGMDSMCMAGLFIEAYGAEHCAIAHCNFNLRAEESDGDEAFVREWAVRKGVTFHCESFDTESYVSENGISVEMAARELRYMWFVKLCRDFGYSCIAVAHHADDNAETMLLNLVRGTGLKGLCGMKRKSRVPYSDEGDSFFLLRPMLDFTKKQIEGYVFRNGVKYRDDRTNTCVEFKRNRIRHEIFPLLGKINPSFVRTFNREMAYFNEAEEILSDWCREKAEKVVEHEGDSSLTVSVSALMECPQWRYLLYYILEPYGFNSSVTGALEDLLESSRTVSGKRFESATHVLMTGRDRLTVTPKQEVAEQADMVVSGPGEYSFNGQKFTVEVIDWEEGMPLKQPAGVLAFDSEVLSFPFTCRGWRRGDWMIPFGMKGRKKVSDIFADLRYEARDKENAVMIIFGTGVEESRVAGILGVRMDHLCRVRKGTASVVIIRKQNN